MDFLQEKENKLTEAISKEDSYSMEKLDTIRKNIR